MSLCGEIHPDDPIVSCDRSLPTTGHPQHSGVKVVGSNVSHVDWPNADYVAPVEKKPGSKRAKLANLAEQVRTVERLSSEDGAAQEAAKVYVASGAHSTRLGQVADRFVRNVGKWLDSSSLQTSEIGGLAGSRRMRELRDEYSWPIETRRDPLRPGVWQHRLTHLPDNLE